MLWTLIAVLVSLAVLAFRETTAPTVLEWDLSRSQTVADLRWPADKPSEFCALQGEYLVTLRLPEGKVFQGDAVFIHCDREGDVVTSLAVHSGNRTTDEAFEEANA